LGCERGGMTTGMRMGGNDTWNTGSTLSVLSARTFVMIRLMGRDDFNVTI